MNVEIVTIPAHFAYEREYLINGYEDFFDEETGDNKLQELEDRMLAANPNVVIPESPNDYNYFIHDMDEDFKGTMHVIYRDMVENKGEDAQGDYRFVDVPEVEAVTAFHEGPYETIGDTFKKIYNWMNANGYEPAEGGRSSAIHGPWDRESPNDYVNEIQIPIKKIR